MHDYTVHAEPPGDRPEHLKAVGIGAFDNLADAETAALGAERYYKGSTRVYILGGGKVVRDNRTGM